MSNFLLVFSKCIRAGFGAFSTSKYRVNGGTKFCNLRIILKSQAVLIVWGGGGGGGGGERGKREVIPYTLIQVEDLGWRVCMVCYPLLPLPWHPTSQITLPVIKVKDLLDTYNCGCGPFCVSLRSDRRLKWLSNTDFVYFFKTKGILMSVRDVTHVIKLCWQKLWHCHDILHYVSKFWCSEHVRLLNFLLAKNHRENIMKRTINTYLFVSIYYFFQLSAGKLTRCNPLHIILKCRHWGMPDHWLKV